jgi:hypothetical protein
LIYFKVLGAKQMEHGKYDSITQVVQQQQPSLSFPVTNNLQSQLSLSCIALATIVGLTLFVREIRLLVKICKDS